MSAHSAIADSQKDRDRPQRPLGVYDTNGPYYCPQGHPERRPKAAAGMPPARIGRLVEVKQGKGSRYLLWALERCMAIDTVPTAIH